MSWVDHLNTSSKDFPRSHKEGVFSAISAGVFFVVVGVIFVTTPNLFDKVTAFLGNFDIMKVPNTEVLLPAPASPGDHSVLYSAVAQFSFVWSLYQLVILALRFVVRSPLSKKAETVSNVVFWFGTSYLIQIFLDELTSVTTWFEFWSAVIVLIGVSLLARAAIFAGARALQ